MTVLIGRIGPPVSDLSLPEPTFWDQDGSTVRATFRSTSATLEPILSLRQMVVNLADNPDEPVVPVVWTADATVAGFYRVTAAAASPVESGYGLPDHPFDFTVTLERVQGYATPVIESVLTGGLRANIHSITDTNALAWFSVPAAVSTIGSVALVFETGNTRMSATGDLLLTTVPPTPPPSFYDAVMQWTIAPTDYYDGAATIEVGSPLRTVVGREVPQNAVANWRLSNGLVRATPNVSPGLVTVEWFDGTAWESARTVQPAWRQSATPHPMANPAMFTVLRNSPELCVVRITYSESTSTTITPGYLDLSLRRGDRNLVGVFAVYQEYGTEIGIDSGTTHATALTGGARETSDDGAGNRSVLMSAQGSFAGTYDIELATGTVLDFGVGCEIGGSGATGDSIAQNLIYQYMGAISERQIVTTR